MVFSSSGKIFYASESITSLLGYLQSDLMNATIYEIAYQEDQKRLYNIFMNPKESSDQSRTKIQNQVSFTCHMKRGGLDIKGDAMYELVRFVGYFRKSRD